jgi:hypothetical protein
VDTVTTIEAYEKTPSGAHKITFLGGTVAGTRDDAIGDLAELILKSPNPNPVGVQLDKRDGRVYIQKMYEIEPPDELAPSEDVAKSEAVAPGSDPTVTPDDTDLPAKIETSETMIDSDEEIVTTENLQRAANSLRIAHVLVNDLEEQLGAAGLSHNLLPDIQANLAEAATELLNAKVQ